ncbi:uncharacterized protein C10orf143 homolog isoform X2 [Hemicordylus capensis]|uniref:uncharacterized protein C10orf143 homolog isoform X2 n=1 Tax=Hemicordylus capensis TaxID=884348 RepID=UPI00230259B7|nr:uncharacterized protein C10orf143 homolog isoform X2 [Hemicordylus capensis]
MTSKLRNKLHRTPRDLKRVCRRLENAAQEISACHPPSKCVKDYWDMDEDLKQKDPTELFRPQFVKEKPISMIFPDNETRTPSQPCPRCIAGEPGHFGHIMGL